MAIHSFNTHLLDACYFPGLMPGGKDREKESAWSCLQRALGQVQGDAETDFYSFCSGTDRGHATEARS